jgi:hypothetical protein
LRSEQRDKREQDQRTAEDGVFFRKVFHGGNCPPLEESGKDKQKAKL